MARSDDQYIVRFPPGMRDQIKAEAKANGRSMNAEIVFRLGRYAEISKRFSEDTRDYLAPVKDTTGQPINFSDFGNGHYPYRGGNS